MPSLQGWEVPIDSLAAEGRLLASRSIEAIRHQKTRKAQSLLSDSKMDDFIVSLCELDKEFSSSLGRHGRSVLFSILGRSAGRQYCPSPFFDRVSSCRRARRLLARSIA